MQRINEGSAFQWVYVPVDTDSVPAVPVSARYRVDCLTTGRQIQDWAAIPSPIAGDNLITITAAQNAIIDDSNRIERKQMLIETTGALGARNDPTVWEVVNIYGVR